MSNDTGKRKVNATVAGEGLVELDVPLEELVRRGARTIIQRAIEAEVQTLLAEYEQVRLLDGRQAVVRNGSLPSREILTGVGPVEVQVPKVRDRSGAGVKFSSGLVPAYVRRSPRVSAALPWRYLKGVSSGNISDALTVLLGEQAKGLSAHVLGRLKAQWAEEYQGWGRRSLAGKQYVYWWADGIYTWLARRGRRAAVSARDHRGDARGQEGVGGCQRRLSRVHRILARRGSRDLKARGLSAGPRLSVGDGALGLWNALAQVYPDTVHQRCWVHKSANVLSALPKSLQGKAKSDLQQIWMAPTRGEAKRAFDRFLKRYGAKYPKATEKLLKDRDALMAFYQFPAEHWIHLRTSNPIESTFATLRQRTARTKNCVTRTTFLGLAFKLTEEAAKSWRGIRAPERLTELLSGTVYQDGYPVADDPPEGQRDAA